MPADRIGEKILNFFVQGKRTVDNWLKYFGVCHK